MKDHNVILTMKEQNQQHVSAEVLQMHSIVSMQSIVSKIRKALLWFASAPNSIALGELL